MKESEMKESPKVWAGIMRGLGKRMEDGEILDARKQMAGSMTHIILLTKEKEENNKT